jgi:hypothetical protein
MNDLIYSYTLKDPIADGLIKPIFENRWPQLSGGKPIVATNAIYSSISLAAMLEIWNEFVVWNRKIKHTLPEEDQLFYTVMNDQKVWVMESGKCFTILYPSDY